MPLKNKIVLICNNEELTEDIKAKILLLRGNDEFSVIRENNCIEYVLNTKPSVIFYHVGFESENFIKFLEEIKNTHTLNSSSIIAIFDYLNENTLCTAFEKGMTDFLMTDSTDSEFTIRTIWALQKTEILKQADSKNNILSQLQIIDEENNTYTENYTYTILKEESTKDWGTFTVIAPDIEIRSKKSSELLMKEIKKNIRSNDILGFASDYKIYLWFKKTETKNVLKILEKIQNNIKENITFSAGFIETKNIEFDKAEDLANTALSKALLKGNSFVCAQEPKQKDMFFEKDVQNFKLNKEFLIKKVEKVLSPLFYQIQKRLEEKLFETKIIQKVEEDLSYFCLENKNIKSTFSVKSSGFTQITIEMTHESEKEEIKPRKVFLEKEEFNEERIEYLLDSFIKYFQYYANN